MNTLQAYRSMVLSRILAAFAAALLAAAAVALPDALIAAGSATAGSSTSQHV
jgi:hypothetical protein